jgi:hypothetical protein
VNQTGTSFGWPPDTVSWAALALAGVALALVVLRAEQAARLLRGSRPRWLVGGLALAAALLSAGYVLYYLRGGPRIIDATTYWLQARAMADGHFAFPVPVPAASFRGRFLLPAGEGTELAPIFPPGYPLVLALGWLLRAPLAVGPVIGAALVVTTYALAQRLLQQKSVALLAAALSAACAALRYHTADTMSHGWSALLATTALLGAVSARQNMGRPRSLWAAGAGLACGWLISTRPLTGVVVCLITGALVLPKQGARSPFLAGLLPGLALLLAYQRATTGQWLGSTHLAYYALADGPPGCFSYGFGKGVGCRYEHADFVQRSLPHGYGVAAALATTGRRLYSHALDLANFRPIALLLPVAAVVGRRHRGVVLLFGTAVALVVAHVPFYFDGSYPGGGARFFADVLPLEHILLAWILRRLGLARFTLPAALAGYALQAGQSHVALSEREGGRPMFEPAVLKAHGVDNGLIFVNTDHGFNLGHAPGQTDPERAVVVARLRGDAHDRLLWERLGRPRALRYAYDPFVTGAVPTLREYRPDKIKQLRFEAENLWPPLATRSGWAHPTHLGSGCASAGRGLRLRPHGPHEARVTVEVVAAHGGMYELVSGWVAYGTQRVSVRVRLGADLASDHRAATVHDCWTLPPIRAELAPGPHRVELTASSSAAVLDYLELVPIGRPAVPFARLGLGTPALLRGPGKKR